MRLLYTDLPRQVALYSETHTLVFREARSKSKAPTVAVQIVPNADIQDQGFRPLLSREVFGCLGTMLVGGDIFVAIVTGAVTNVASPLDYETVDKIYLVDFILLRLAEWDFVALDSNGYPLGEAGAEDYELRTAHPCHELRKLLSNGLFYYSNDFDLTLLLQNRGVRQSKTPQTFVGEYRAEYMWNLFMMEELFRYRTNLDVAEQTLLNKNKFLTTVIRGFAKSTHLDNGSLTIISKQSWKRAGTRFNARGIDDNGNVANFVETEFIFDSTATSSVFAFTQIRGSVPTFWEQDTTLINPKITLTRSVEAVQPIFNKHFDEICQKYGVCHIVNLLSKTKPAEVQVLRQYKQLYQASSLQEEMAFTDFDFHHETKQSGFAGATKILPYLHDSLEQFGWFSYDVEAGEAITRQDGVFRVNCLDCLDRTNLVQQVISRQVLEHILSSYLDGAHSNLVLAHHNTLWADNGDAISQIYTGTNALKSSFSRSGKMNIAGALSDVTKSVSRMYQNTFVDSKKQSVMDLLLGYDARNEPVHIYDPIGEFVNEKLKELEASFTSYSTVLMFVGTFNVNATAPGEFDLSAWLFPPENDALPEIYALGIQELIELNAGSILTADNSKPTAWARLLENQLNARLADQYLLLRTEAIASMCIYLFVKKSQLKHVTQVAGTSKKTGLGGIAANKGACSVRFNFGLTTFALVTAHLAAGVNATVERFNDYKTIELGLTFTRNYKLADHDHVVWFGDLNYRLLLPNDRCRYLIENGAFDELFKTDQLQDELDERNGAFRGYREGKITFYPTYKYDKGTSNYDTSEKQRVPSWTDRVLYKSKNPREFKQLNYNSPMDIFVSDHKPVYLTFKSRVKFVDDAHKQALAAKLYLSYKQENGLGDLLEIAEKPKDFTIDTLSEMNLLDDDLDTSPAPAPRLPSRPATQASLPKRIPPPPLSRRAFTSDLQAQRTTPRKLPPAPEYDAKGNMKTVTSPVPQPYKPPIGFSSTPLIPSRSGSSSPVKPPKPAPRLTASTPGLRPEVTTPATPATSASVGSSPTPAPKPLKPLVPAKPSALKVERDEPEVAPSAPSSASSSAPTPPPPRAQKMSEWKPLVPQ